MALERWVPASMRVKDSRGMGKAIERAGGGIGAAANAYLQGRIEAIVRGAELDHEQQMADKHQRHTTDLLTQLPTGTTEFEHETKGGKTRVKVSGGGIGTVRPVRNTTAGQGPKPIPKAEITKLVKLKIQASSANATQADREAFIKHESFLHGKHGARRVNAAVKDHPLMKQGTVDATPATSKPKPPTAAAINRQNKAAASYVTPSAGKKLDPAVKAQNAAARTYITKLDK